MININYLNPCQNIIYLNIFLVLVIDAVSRYIY